MMHTRCPACQTTFRITLEQVKARHGKVRCGRCQNVFDALEHLVESITALSPPSSPPAESAPPTQSATLDRVTETGAPPATPAAEVDKATAPPEAGHEIPHDLPAGPPSPLSAAYAGEKKPARRLAWPWVLGSVLAVLVLVLQAILFWRVELATRHPDLRPHLEALCEQFECSVGLPAQIGLLKIENSDLVPEKPGRLELSAALHNLAPYAQEWPYLELTLTDAADRAVVRRVIPPQEYAAPATGGFPANGEFAVQVRLDIGGLPAAGYRLYLFYP